MNEDAVDAQYPNDCELGPYLVVCELGRIKQRIVHKEQRSADPQDQQPGVDDARQEPEDDKFLFSDPAAYEEPEQHQINHRCAAKTQREADKMKKANCGL